MDKLVVDFAGLRDAQDTIARAHAEIEEQLTGLGTVIDRLASAWQGQAHDAFHRNVAQWRASAAVLHDQLAELHNMVGVAHDNHAVAVVTNSAIWRV
ncbi:MAG: WXG100 family type VII secretion target [Pseudonocardiaceae bacterium]